MGRIYCPQFLIICKWSFKKSFESSISVKLSILFVATIVFRFVMLVYRDLTPGETSVEFLKYFLNIF